MNGLQKAPVCQKTGSAEIFPVIPEERDAGPFSVSVPPVVFLAEIHRLSEQLQWTAGEGSMEREDEVEEKKSALFSKAGAFTHM